MMYMDSMQCKAMLMSLLVWTGLVNDAFAKTGFKGFQLGPEHEVLSTEYSGAYSCGPETYIFTLDLNINDFGALEGVLTAESIGGGQDIKSLPLSSKVSGWYNGLSGRFDFDMENDSSGQSESSVEGVFQLDATGFIAVWSSPDKKICSPLIASRGTPIPREWRYIYKEASRVGLSRKPEMVSAVGSALLSKKDASQKKCSKDIIEWLKQPAGNGVKAGDFADINIIRNLFSDAHFTEYFRKPFFRVSAKDRQKLDLQLRDICPNDPEFKALVESSAALLRDAFSNSEKLSHADKAVSAIAYRKIREWLEELMKAIALMSSGGGKPEDIDTVIADVEPIVKLLWPKEESRFNAFMVSQKTIMILPGIGREKKIELARVTPEFSSLERLSLFPEGVRRRHKNLDNEEIEKIRKDIARKVNELAWGAAKKFANKARGIDGATKLALWQVDYSALSNILNKKTHKKIVKLFADRKAQITDEVLTRERVVFTQTIVPLTLGAGALEKAVILEGKLEGKYGLLEGEPGFLQFAKKRKERRLKDLNAALNFIEQSIGRQTTHAGLQRIRNKYLLKEDEDSVPGKKIIAAIDAQKAIISPFADLSAGEYLNAIYAGDFTALKKLDTGYTVRAERLGKNVPTSNGKLSLIVPVFAVYLLDYQHTHAACLDSSAHIFNSASNSRDLINKVFGEGFQAKPVENFTVNERFVNVFKKLGLSGQESADKAMLIEYIGHRKILNDAVTGVRAAMTRYACATDQMKTFEAYMLDYFNMQ